MTALNPSGPVRLDVRLNMIIHKLWCGYKSRWACVGLLSLVCWLGSLAMIIPAPSDSTIRGCVTKREEVSGNRSLLFRPSRIPSSYAWVAKSLFKIRGWMNPPAHTLLLLMFCMLPIFTHTTQSPNFL